MTAAEFERWLLSPPAARRPLVVGVLNVTPDSFSDGGLYADAGAAVDHARRMAADGADLIDVGGESTRPGSRPVPEAEQVRRVVPVIRAVAGELPVAVSIDTTRSAVVAAALDAGAAVVNDVTAGRDDPQLLPRVAAGGVPVILMHMRGTPATMQADPVYDDVTAEVRAFLTGRAEAAEQLGVARHRVLVDPGIGFGKTASHNLELLRRLPELAADGRPVMVGTSRKGFVGRATGRPDPADRAFGTAATVAWAVANGSALVRVHDVGAMAQVVRMVRAIQVGEP